MGLIEVGFLAFAGFLEGPGAARSHQRGSGRLREAQGDPRSSSEMSGASFRKIRFFGPGRRLAASEGPKIAGGASLARREKLRFPAIRRRKGC